MSELPPPIQRLGRYDILRVLGQGAMGVVYEARDPNLDRRVAIKTVRVVGMATAEIAEYEQRFKTEARSAGRLQHPNIVSVYDSNKHVDATGQTAYIVMEFVQGEDLKHFLDHGKRFSLEQTAYMMADLLSALDYAHKHKIIHRDIKPANLLLTKDGRVKLTDFGVARITDSGEATKTSGGTVGTLKYMSPEQVAGKGVDSSSDIFSAGIVLYQLLTGVRPFDGEGYLDIVSKIVKEDPIPPSQIVGALPPAIDAVVAKALAKSKLDRFADAASFAAALKAAVNNADLTITPSARANREVAEAVATFPGSVTGTGGSTVTQELELVYWKDIKESTEPEVLEGFLKRFPIGIYADLAKRRLKTLADQEKASGQSRYETTQLRKPGESTMVAMGAPIGTIITAGVTEGAAATSAALSADDPTLPPSAYNDSEYGPSTQFAPTQFSSTEPIAANEKTARKQSKVAAEGPMQTMPSPLERPSATGKSSKSLIIATSVGVLVAAGAAFMFLRGPSSPQTTAGNVTPTAVISSDASSSALNTQTVVATSTNTATTLVAASQTATTPASTRTGVTAPALAASAPRGTSTASGFARAASAAAALIANRRASGPSVPTTTAIPTPSAPTPSTPVDSAPAPRAISNPQPNAAPAPAAEPAARAPLGPREACDGRLLLGFLQCLAEQCDRPVFRNHPVCVERRIGEQRRRDSSAN